MGNDVPQQIARIILYVLTGFLAKYGIVDGEFLAQVGAVVTGVVSIGWWLFWNKKRA